MAVAGDLNAFIERLRHHHGLLGSKGQLIDRLLLHGGCRKGRLRPSLLLLLRHGGDEGVLLLEHSQHRIGLFLIVELRLLPVHVGEARLEGVIVRGPVLALYGPVFLRMEGFDLLFPLADEAHRHGLHAPCGEAAVDLLPQPGGELVPHEAVQHAPGLLGIHTVLVDRAGMGHRFPDGRGRDLMEGNAHIVRGIHVQQPGQMPRNGFPFAVGVRCEKDVAGLVGFLLQFLDDRFPAVCIDVLRRKAVVDIHAEGALRQIPQMAHGGHHLVVRSEDALDGPRLCRRFHHDEALALRIRLAPECRFCRRQGCFSFSVTDGDRSLDRHSSSISVRRSLPFCRRHSAPVLPP